MLPRVCEVGKAAGIQEERVLVQANDYSMKQKVTENGFLLQWCYIEICPVQFELIDQ